MARLLAAFIQAEDVTIIQINPARKAVAAGSRFGRQIKAVAIVAASHIHIANEPAAIMRREPP